jgi:hypothetical protein
MRASVDIHIGTETMEEWGEYLDLQTRDGLDCRFGKIDNIVTYQSDRWIPVDSS